MDHLAKLVVALLLALCGVAHAGYAQLAPAAVFTTSGSTVMYRAAANDVIAGGIARVTAGAALSVGGEAVVMPVAARFAANAASFAATGAWPLLVAGIAAPYVIDWIRSKYYDVQGGQVVVQNNTGLCTVAPCYSYRLASYEPWENTETAAISDMCTTLSLHGCYINSSNGGFYGYRNSDNQLTTTGTANVSTQSRTPDSPVYVPATQIQFQTDMSAAPLPDNLPQALPVPLPVQQPIINPSSDPSPVPQPLWVPQGNPVPVPNTSPQQYSQPGTRITPTPSPSSPWQVDVAPEDKISNSPSPVLSPQAVSPTDAASAPTSSQPDDLCKMHPDIVACQGLGTLAPVTLPDTPVPLSIAQDTGWGGGAGSCPASQSFSVQGKSYTLDWSQLCSFATGIRPVVLGLAWLSAALVFFGLSRKNNG